MQVDSRINTPTKTIVVLISLAVFSTALRGEEAVTSSPKADIVIVGAGISGLCTGFESCAQSEAARQLLLSDIAIRKFKLQLNRAVPKASRELTPEFLSPDSDHDVFGGGDLKYRGNPDGSYLLYSVGIDGVNGGGALRAWPPFFSKPNF